MISEPKDVSGVAERVAKDYQGSDFWELTALGEKSGLGPSESLGFDGLASG